MSGSALPMLSYIACNLDDAAPVMAFVDHCNESGIDNFWTNGMLGHAITAAMRARIIATASDLVHGGTGPPWLPRGIRIGLDNGQWGLTLPVEIVAGCCPPTLRTRVYTHTVNVELGKPELQPSGLLFPMPDLLEASEPVAVTIGATALLHLVARLGVFYPAREPAA